MQCECGASHCGCVVLYIDFNSPIRCSSTILSISLIILYREQKFKSSGKTEIIPSFLHQYLYQNRLDLSLHENQILHSLKYFMWSA